jgi:hypothetical protein
LTLKSGGVSSAPAVSWRGTGTAEAMVWEAESRVMASERAVWKCILEVGGGFNVELMWKVKDGIVDDRTGGSDGFCLSQFTPNVGS